MEILPFGKYKGQPVKVLQQDKKYLEWLQAQAWLPNQYPNINTIIINNFQEPSKTPEHNKLQLRFLYQDYCDNFFNYLLSVNIIKDFTEIETINKPSLKELSFKKVTSKIPLVYTYFNCLFEQDRADVLLIYNCFEKGNEDGRCYETTQLYIEVKPILSDDFPAVLRQCNNNSSRFLIIDNFDCLSASFEQVKEVFKRSSIHLILTSEYEGKGLSS